MNFFLYFQLCNVFEKYPSETLYNEQYLFCLFSGHGTGFMKASEMMRKERVENTDKGEEKFSNDLDQYTDHNSQVRILYR